MDLSLHSGLEAPYLMAKMEALSCVSLERGYFTDLVA
jgi:hypothetical protein